MGSLDSPKRFLQDVGIGGAIYKDKVKKPREVAKKASSEAAASAATARTQSNIAESERKKRIKLLQTGNPSAKTESTGFSPFKTLLGS